VLSLFSVLCAEQPFVAAAAGIGGQPDIVFNNKIIIGDYKLMPTASSFGTHNGIAGPATLLVDCKATHHHMQLNLYA
jgi:hypothetical protein